MDKCKTKTSGIMDILDTCDVNLYLHINFILKLLATMSVSITEVERSFSTMKRLKNCYEIKQEINV